MESIKQPLWPRMLFFTALFSTMLLGILIGRLDGSMLYLPFILMMGIFLVLLTFRYESLSFYLLIALLFNETLITFWSGTNPIFLILAGLSIVIVLGRMAIGKHKLVFEKRTAALAFALAVWATLSGLNADGISGIIGGARSFWFLLAFFLLIQNKLIKPKDFYNLSWVLVISLGLLGFWISANVGLQFAESGFSMSGQQLHGFAARMVDSAPLTLWMVIAIPFALNLLFLSDESKFNLRWFLLLFLFFSLVFGIISMLSVTGTFALIISLILWFLIYPRFSIKLKLLSALTIFIVLIYLVLLSPFSDRIEDQLTTIESGEIYDFGTGRGLAWYIGLQAIKEAPILGLGPNLDNVLRYSQPYLTEKILQEQYIKQRDVPGLHPHNMYLVVGALLGIPGLIFLLSLILYILISLVMKIVTNYRGDYYASPEIRYLGYAILVSLTVFLLQVLALGAFIDKYLWLLLGVAVSYLQYVSIKS